MSDTREMFMIIGLSLLIAFVIYFIRWGIMVKQRSELLSEILSRLHLENADSQLKLYDDHIVVKSRQTLDNYSDLKYIRDRSNFETVRTKSETKKRIKESINSFLKDNNCKSRPQYDYVEKQLINYVLLANGYRVLVEYITPAGNKRGERILDIPASRIDEIGQHPELLMTKGEHSKFVKIKNKKMLDDKKKEFYDKVNLIIDYANAAKEALVVKSHGRMIDELISKLLNKMDIRLRKMSSVYSFEWRMLNDDISKTDNQIQEIIKEDQKISEYYESDEFARIKVTCSLITQSQREFNEYIDEKAHSIAQLLGSRVIRNETQNYDVYNYIRPYKKTITPFTAEVSSTVFGSAENKPMEYVVKYFYPNKSQYKEQINKLRMLIEELETLKEAKVIIDNYKEEYRQYIQNVPEFVLKSDESGFFQRLGLVIIDEDVLNVEYGFSYTSAGGMVQRSFTVPMTEENIIDLIHRLTSKLSSETFAKEQRALMTTKLRTYIKERDNYTCCECGNSIYVEPNLLLEIDHILPISKGGLTEEDNLRTLCWKCNRIKGSKIVIGTY